MRILGIDPGFRITGFGVLNVLRNGKLNYIASGCIRAKSGGLSERIKIIYDGVAEIIDDYNPDVMAIEKIFVAHNADSALKLGQARGAAICAGVNENLNISEYTALQIKRAVVGTGTARKPQIQHMVKAILVLSDTPQVDAADALACAICHAHHTVGRQALTLARERRLRVVR